MLPIRDENAHQIFFSNIFNNKPRALTTISLNASIRCEHDDVQTRKSADVKRGELYIEIHV